MQKLKGQLSDFHVSPNILESERAQASRMLRYIEDNGDVAFVRTHRPAHFTASALVLSPDRKQVLLLWHKKANKWLQPGGHADGEVELEQVAAREVLEETGVKVHGEHGAGIFGVDWHHIPASAKEDAHEHADCTYLFTAQGWDLVCNEAEANEVRWFSFADAHALVEDDSVKKLVERFQDGF